MSEKEVIAKTERPVTVSDICMGLEKLGLTKGDTIIVHSSLSAFGWICGGAQALIMALMESVGKDGTIVMPSHSGDWSDPVNWQHPPVPKEWVPIIKENMPSYDKEMTPTRGIGKTAELFRNLSSVRRSDNPLLSFSAWGRFSDEITRDHPLVPQMGMDSPLGSLYKSDAKVLLLGVGYDSCTSFHLAETMIDGTPKVKSGTSMAVNGKRRWVEFEDFEYESGDFDKLGEEFEISCPVNIKKIGNADCRLFCMKSAVDFAVNWLPKNRK